MCKMSPLIQPILYFTFCFNISTQMFSFLIRSMTKVMNRIYNSQIIFCADQLGSCRWLNKTFYFEIWMFEYGRKRTILWCQSRRSWKGWKQTIRGESKRSLGQSRRSGVKADDLLGQSERSRGLKADDHVGPLSTGLAKLPFVILPEKGLAPSTHWEFSMIELKLNMKRAVKRSR